MSQIALCRFLEPHRRTGKQALKAEHRQLLIENQGSKVLASADFEKASSGVETQLKRWDYFIEVDAVAMHAIEVHEFDASALKEKKQGTLAILRRRCPECTETIKWHVIVPRSSLPRQDLLARFRGNTGISVGRNLHISTLQTAS